MPTNTHVTAGRDGIPAVALDRVEKRFGDVVAVAGITLSVQPGEVVALLGPNGAGKTSTIDMLLGLSDPTAGRAMVYGMEPRRAVSLGLVSAVMQTGGLLKDYTVEETVRFTAALFSSTRPVHEVMERAGIAEIAGRRVGKCSGGQQQRLRFALALLSDPELLILDEPTTGMDAGGRRDFWSSIREDTRRGRTVIFATHYLEEADAYADRVVVISRGQVIADGTAAQVKASAHGRVLRATLPGADPAELQRLGGLSGVDAVEVRGDTVTVRGKDTDAVARYLLTQTAARDLEIAAPNLEQAFLAMTAEAGDLATGGTTDSVGFPADISTGTVGQPAGAEQAGRLV